MAGWKAHNMATEHTASTRGGHPWIFPAMLDSEFAEVGRSGICLGRIRVAVPWYIIRCEDHAKLSGIDVCSGSVLGSQYALHMCRYTVRSTTIRRCGARTPGSCHSRWSTRCGTSRVLCRLTEKSKGMMLILADTRRLSREQSTSRNFSSTVQIPVLNCNSFQPGKAVNLGRVMPFGGNPATAFSPSSSHAVTFLYDCVQLYLFYFGLCLTLWLKAGMSAVCIAGLLSCDIVMYCESPLKIEDLNVKVNSGEIRFCRLLFTFLCQCVS